VSGKWYDDNKHGEYRAVVTARFLVTITGHAEYIVALWTLANSVEAKELEIVAAATFESQ
jgi:hypothetical protein